MINAIANVIDVTIGTAAADTTSFEYNVAFQGYVTDGTVSVSINDGNGSAFVLIPLNVSAKQADRLIRQAMAKAVLTVSGFVIDPDDIYIPFS